MNARTTALSALIAVRRQNAWADGALKEYIARDRLSRRDAALAARLVYGVVQNRLLLDFDLAQVVSSPLAKLQPVVLDILRLGAYQILFLDKIPVSAAVNEAVEQTKTYANKRAAGLVNGSLRALARQKDTLAAPQDLATKYSHPQPLVDCLRVSMGVEEHRRHRIHALDLRHERKTPDQRGQQQAQHAYEFLSFHGEPA